MNMVLDGERPPLERIPYDTPGPYVELMTACWEQEPHARPHFKQVTVLILSLVNLIMCYATRRWQSYLTINCVTIFGLLYAVFIIWFCANMNNIS